jgi:hypothetical protein
MTDSAKARDEIRAIREGLSHPVVDGDGHLLESVPLLLHYVDELGGAAASRRVVDFLPDIFTGPGDARSGEGRGPWWPSPSDADYQATVMAPGLLSEGLEDLGIDFSILYPSLGLALCTMPDDDLRPLVCRALNTMNAELCGPHSNRLTPAAVIPMHRPEEAIGELRHAVEELGLRVAMIPPAVARPLAAHPEAFPQVCRFDRFAIDSDYDYTPVWQAFCDLKIAVTSHGGIGFRYLPDGLGSPSNYVFNHVLGHAQMQEGFCRSLLFGGVPKRFPELRFGFLEGGVLWAIALMQAVEEHWEKRSARGLSAYDPARLDATRLGTLLERYGLPPQPAVTLETSGPQPWVRDEFEDSGIEKEEDLARMFSEQFYFGCESDDRGVHRAVDAAGNPLGVRLRPVFSSDIGHWDVPELTDVLPQSRALVEAKLLAEPDYARFVFEYPVRLHTDMNPDFFQGTVVEAPVRELIEST